MRHIITAKNIIEGTSIDDVPSPLLSTEIATEMIITRLRAIEMLNEGQIHRSDTIVTRRDRFCLYENLFDNVIDYKEFLDPTIEKDEVIDLVLQLYTLCTDIRYKPFYQRYEKDRLQLENIEYNDLLKKELDPFICILIRKRAAWSEKNLPDEYWIGLIEEMKKNGYKTYVFGKETSDIPCDVNVTSFQDWCSLLANRTCKSIVSTCSGGVYPVFFNKRTDNKLIVIDDNGLTALHNGDPSFYGDCINFNRTDVRVFPYIPKYDQIIKACQ